MIEVLQFLFATAKDRNLYFNQDGLVKELLNEHQFTLTEVKDAIEWFAPVISGLPRLDINPLAIRSISSWEVKHLPKAIITQILKWERKKQINLTEREILLDRLTELGLDWEVEDDDMQVILDGLIYHLQHYKYQLYAGNCSPQTAYSLSNNFTVH